MTLKSSVAAALLLAHAVSADCSNKLAVSYPPPEAAPGWSFQLVANGFTKPRGLQFDPSGGLLVVDAGAGLVHLSLKDEGGTCVSVANKTTLLASKELNHGIALTDDGKTLYASSAENVYAWTYDASAVTLSSTNQTVVTNMSTSDHTTRTLLLSRKKPGTLLVSRGSQSNEDADAEQLSSGHSQIRSFDLSSSSSTPHDFLDGHVIGWGLRNSVGVAEHPKTGGLWSVENSVDQLRRKGQDIHQDNPAEELNYHGVLGSSDDQGGNYGYPVCYAIWNATDFPDLGALATASQFPDDDAPGNVTDAACNDAYVAPRLAFQAHAAPLDVKFDAAGGSAYVSFHGSWDRDAPVGYRVASVAFGADGRPTAGRTSMDAAVDVLATKDLSNCPDKCFRPVGLAWDAKGRLWLSSDSTGEIFVLQHDGSSGGGKDGKSAAAGRGMPGLAAVTALALAVAALLS
ncbi:Six-bladed beta-propeller, TolB-like protein [Cordyceps fumosorosea ARSEF 2679]|uniref:Six-bladed beta-propeller, TolB-like protein n=1 Tax=Cordyceps fumosorosea (strain ARSEF 2679) TaxID=1081104 RepID=A0A167VTG7_CORFA|nr:Six-bladed beta-propeller, TolB-like protein [Cordyceps fumosorosea ARSEF 2679]OAA62965.1 Six-bladed beta-propeller, TolB-like protein [Cordyceps fumosorosea ARSEF 2679]